MIADTNEPSQVDDQSTLSAGPWCAECGEPMTLIEPGQLYHPLCEPEQ